MADSMGLAAPQNVINMPLELGIFMGAKAFGSGQQKKKAGVVLDTERYRYQRYISDIAGQDIRGHHGDPSEVIRHVRNFLSTLHSLRPLRVRQRFRRSRRRRRA